DLDDFTEQADRAVQVAVFPAGRAQGVAGVVEFRLQSQRLLIFDNRLGCPPQTVEGQRQIVTTQVKSAIQFDGFQEFRHSGLRLPRIAQDGADQELRLGVLRIDPHGGGKMVESFLRLTVLKFTNSILPLLYRGGRAGRLLRTRRRDEARKQEQPEKLGTYLHRGLSISLLGDTDKFSSQDGWQKNWGRKKVKTQECSAQKTFLWLLCSSLCFCGRPGFLSTESTSMPNTSGKNEIFNFYCPDISSSF